MKISKEELIQRSNQSLKDNIYSFKREGIKIDFKPEISFYDNLLHLTEDVKSTINQGFIPLYEDWIWACILEKITFKKKYDLDISLKAVEYKSIDNIPGLILRHQNIEEFDNTFEISIISNLQKSPSIIDFEIRKNLWNLIQLKNKFLDTDSLNQGIALYVGYPEKYYSFKRKFSKDFVGDIFSEEMKDYFYELSHLKEHKTKNIENLTTYYCANFINSKMKNKKLKNLLDKIFRKEIEAEYHEKVLTEKQINLSKETLSKGEYMKLRFELAECGFIENPCKETLLNYFKNKPYNTEQLRKELANQNVSKLIEYLKNKKINHPTQLEF
ncbi:MAG: hypothetical protein AB7V77_01830 [Candidatus Woesearchaeota archaeon]